MTRRRRDDGKGRACYYERMNLFGWGKNPDWKKQLQALGQAHGHGELAEKLAAALPGQLKTLKKEARSILSAASDAEGFAQNNMDLLRAWHTQGNPPSLPALCILGIEHFRLELAPDMIQAVLTAAILGEIENPLPYHNNMHFRKVLLQLLRLVHVHNEIYKGTARALGPEQVAWLMMAACIHDYGHDGVGNTLRGVHHPGYIERRSYTMAEPYLMRLHLSDEGMLYLRTMLLSTDVSPLGDPGNYMNQMKAAYRFHFLGERKGLQSLNLDRELMLLQKDPALATMSLLLHEADISTSAGLHYDITKYETALYAREIGEDQARPSHILEFLDTVCQQRMLSDAAQKLYAANMARIYALAEEDARNGNLPLPRADYTEFIVPDEARGAPRTIN
jgi:hypothetical protein